MADTATIGGLDTDLVDGIIARATAPGFDRFQAQLRSSGYCARPVRLRGQVCDHNGTRVWSTATEPDGVLRKACGNRREAVCPSCAERYRQDAYHLIAAGLRGGKGIPDTVSQHPLIFATLTAPSFGPVHTGALGTDGEPRRCRARRNKPTCPHGRPLHCTEIHDDNDPCLGEPLCPECFDYRAAVLWNNLLGELWRRTTIYLPRKLAAALGVTQKHLRQLVRASYVKVAEYQHRGLVHLHVVIRLDRAMPKDRAAEIRRPGPTFTTQLLEDALRAAAAAVTVPVPEELGSGYVTWGEQLDVKHVGEEAAIKPRRCAGYLAKYSTKATEQAGGVLHRVDRRIVDQLPVREHVREFMRQAFDLDDQAQPERRIGRNAHNFGYRGHCLTKSRRYSTTFKAMREERERHVHQQLLANAKTPEAQRRLAELGRDGRVSNFTFAGVGHLTTAEAFLAAQSAAQAREARRLAWDERANQLCRVEPTREEQAG
jgi:hypothetical protein